jgi:hypothetical protein
VAGPPGSGSAASPGRDDTLGNLGGTSPAWGYHGYEYWLTLGNLLQDVAGEEAAFQALHPSAAR